MNKTTNLVSAFPGTGKSYAFSTSSPNLKVLDSDSSTFDKSDFPANYIRHIKENIGIADIIYISSHKTVRDALIDEKLHFTLVYPSIELMNEYVERYRNRGSNEKFITLLQENWVNWITELKNIKSEYVNHIVLKKGDTIANRLVFPIWDGE